MSPPYARADLRVHASPSIEITTFHYGRHLRGRTQSQFYHRETWGDQTDYRFVDFGELIPGRSRRQASGSRFDRGQPGRNDCACSGLGLEGHQVIATIAKANHGQQYPKTWAQAQALLLLHS